MKGQVLLAARDIVKMTGMGASSVRACNGVDLSLRGGQLTLLSNRADQGRQ